MAFYSNHPRDVTTHTFVHLSSPSSSIHSVLTGCCARLCWAVRSRDQKTGTEGGLGRERVLGAGLGREGLVEPNLYYIVH